MHLRLHRFPQGLQDGDSRHIFLGSIHRAALSALLRGIRAGETFVAVTGAAGLGKTTLVNAALSMLADEAPPGLSPRIIRIDNPDAEPLGLRRLMGQMIGAGDQDLSPDELERVLAALTPAGRESLLLLVIDNAQALQPDAMRFLLLMQRMRPPDTRHMQVIFVGRPEFWTGLEHDDALQMERHVPTRCRLVPLPEPEARDYAEYLLSPPDGAAGPLATDPALDAILRATGGIPGRIRAAIERAVAIGASRNRDRVTLDVAREAIASLAASETEAKPPERTTAVAMLAAAIATGDATFSPPEQKGGRAGWRTGWLLTLTVGLVLLGGVGYWRMSPQWSEWLRAETGLGGILPARSGNGAAPQPDRLVPQDTADISAGTHADDGTQTVPATDAAPAPALPAAPEEKKTAMEAEPTGPNDGAITAQEPAPPMPATPTPAASVSDAHPPAADTAAAPSIGTPPTTDSPAPAPPTQLSLAAPAPAGGTGASLPTAPAVALSAPAALPGKSADILSPGLVSELLERGDAMLAAGDISAARLLFRRAAAAGSGRAATQVGKTYDPRYLNRVGAMGIQADPAEAASWYRRAAAMGSSEATQLLDGFAAGAGK